MLPDAPSLVVGVKVCLVCCTFSLHACSVSNHIFTFCSTKDGRVENSVGNSRQNQVGCFNHKYRVVTLVAYKLAGETVIIRGLLWYERLIV